MGSDMMMNPPPSAASCGKALWRVRETYGRSREWLARQLDVNKQEVRDLEHNDGIEPAIFRGAVEVIVSQGHARDEAASLIGDFLEAEPTEPYTFQEYDETVFVDEEHIQLETGPIKVRQSYNYPEEAVEALKACFLDMASKFEKHAELLRNRF